MKNLILFLLASHVFAAGPMPSFGHGQKIGVQNSILTKVNGKTISMMDVKKKMDLIFHQHYPQHVDSESARFQFYEASWRQVLRDMIDNELVISDALDKEIKLTDGDVREEMEARFGPHVMQTLDKIGLTYDEACKMVKNELIVQRMNWFFIQKKAMDSITPQDIRQAYRLYLNENPAYSEWKYHVISIRTDQENDTLVNQVYETLTNLQKTPTDAKGVLKSLEEPGVTISVSTEFTAKTQDLSEIHRESLRFLNPGSYSKPSFQVSRVDRKTVYRIFYLIDKTDYSAPTFEGMAKQLQNELMNKAAAQESTVYLNKLRKFYGFDDKQAIPDDLHPFSLQ